MFGPGFRLLLTCGIIAAATSLPLEAWPALGLLFVSVFALLTAAEVSLDELLRRTLLVLPFVGGLAVAVPLARGDGGGWDFAVLLLARGVLSLWVLLWLIRSVGLGQLLRTLHRLGLPALLLSVVPLVERSVGLLWEEQNRLALARRARTAHRPRGLAKWKAGAEAIGVLLLRGFDRSERVGRAMTARGWTGGLDWLTEPGATSDDAP